MYTPPFTLSAKAINLIAEIYSLLEHFNIKEVTEQELRLRKANRIKTIHSSLAIEGNNLSEGQVADIINGKTVVAPIREIQEVKNAIRVYDIYDSLDAFKEKDLLKAHSIMMEALIDFPGRYRSGGVGVYGDKGLVHMAPPPQRVPELMGSLFEWLDKAEDNLLVRSCVFHYEFEFIHPFMDGNGRTGRLWQSLILGKLNPVFNHLPVENMIHANQQEYYDAIGASTAKGDSGPFIEFMLGEIAKTLRDAKVDKKAADKVTKKVTNKVADKVANKVANKSDFKFLYKISEKPTITIKKLSEELGMSESGVKKIITRLSQGGLIKREGSRKKGNWILLFDINDLK